MPKDQTVLHYYAEMEVTIRSYFNLGLGYAEIIACLASIDRIHISMRSLKRILERLKLFRRVYYSDMLEISMFLLSELQDSGKMHGYKMMHLKCIQNGYVVTQETIREMMHILDTLGVKQRQRRRLMRRHYSSVGPNYVWHIDGYDQLKPYGICTHGAIDGFSRNVLWLEAYTTNYDPKIIAGYYMEAVTSLNGCPTRVRAAMGTENCYIMDMQMLLRNTGEDPDVNSCYLFGSSNRNQRIERWWGILRTQNVQCWMDFFTVLESTCCFKGDFLDKAILQFCSMDLIQTELDEVSRLWNSHRLRRVRNQNSPNGRPVIMYTCPHLYDSQYCLCTVTRAQIYTCTEECVAKGPFTCDETVFELCTLIMHQSM